MKGYNGAMIERFYDIKKAALIVCEKNHMRGLSELYEVVVSFSLHSSLFITKNIVARNDDS